MICPTVGAEPFAAPIVASPVVAKHGYCHSWLTSGLYKSVHVLFFRMCGGQTFCKCRGNAELG